MFGTVIVFCSETLLKLTDTLGKILCFLMSNQMAYMIIIVHSRNKF